MAEKSFPMTAEGKANIEKELETLKTVKRQEIIERIKVARGFGDLSENSEYESAKDEQSTNETRISLLEEQLRYSKVVDASDTAPDEVAIGKKVTFVEDGEDDAESYSIVGSAESDPMAGKISNDSPIARALIGKKIGDIVDIQTPGGSFAVKITAVESL
ncbi:transcription elongation factor GreA [Lapidilactobacillus achengensis]|uniref:Transcription elongation factor GreA n=1 Tax=Lapidilactobacillus achengensis TaxID=2486000 RepID=A0ABW1URX4_9LACO|nr:transcription elongation factor GreA [Lapidilactobacillus achengensis]